MFWMKNRGWYCAPETGDGGGAEPAPDAAATMYPDDQPADAAISDAATVADKAADGAEPPVADPVADAVVDPKADDTTGDWAEYVDDPAKTPEENAAAKLANDAQHPINVVPEDGKYTLTMPEGIEVDQPLLDALGPTFKELNLSQGHAQMLADKFIAAQQERQTQQTQQWADTVSGWADKAKSDPDMGGAKWDATVAAAIRARDQFGTPELNEYLEASGAGNHPEVIRYMAKVGVMIAEDNPITPDNPGSVVERDPAAILYPNDKPKG